VIKDQLLLTITKRGNLSIDQNATTVLEVAKKDCQNGIRLVIDKKINATNVDFLVSIFSNLMFTT
jgi:hypothetical protein